MTTSGNVKHRFGSNSAGVCECDRDAASGIGNRSLLALTTTSDQGYSYSFIKVVRHTASFCNNLKYIEKVENNVNKSLSKVT